MNIKRVLGAFAAGLVAAGTFTAQANDEVFWLGAEGGKWSEEANWVPHAPGTDTVNFNVESNAVNVVDLDVTTTIQDLYVAPSTYALITNSSDEVHTLTTVDSWMTTQGGATLEVAGPKTVVKIVAKKAKNVSGCNNYVKGTHIASGGATLTMNRADPDDNGCKMVARGSGSKLEFALVRWENTVKTGDINNNEFVAEDGGTVTSKGSWRLAQGDAPKYVARNGGTLDIANILADGSYYSWSGAKYAKIKPYVVCDEATLKMGALVQGVSGGEVAITNGTVSVSGALSLSDGNFYTDFTLAGDNPVVEGKNNAGFTFGSTTAGNANRLTFKLFPTLNWSETEGRIRQSNTSSNAKIALRNTVKYEIDCSAFKEWYGTKTVMLFQQAYGSGASYAIDTKKVKLVGDGAENCTVSFAQQGQNYMMTIDSKNLAPGSVARVGHYGYPTIQAAVEAAGADDVVTLVSDVALTEAVTVGKAVTLDLATFTVACDANGFASTKLFDVTSSGSLTVNGTTGAVDGGDNAAVYVTGGAFYVPAASTATFTAANDTVVFYNAGAMPAAEICGGSFASTDGAPVASGAAEGHEAVGGILKGGTYNKEPDAALIAEGYRSEKNGDVWEVVLAGPAVCRVGDRLFSSLRRAYEVVGNHGDIFIVSNATVEALTLDINKDVTIDLDGHTLTPEEAGAIFTVTAGTLHLYDNTSGEKGALKGGVVVNGGTLQISVIVDADPALTVNGGSVSAWGTLNGGVTIYGGTLNMNATVNAQGVAIAANGGTLNVNGGSYTGGESAFVAGQGFTAKCIDTGSFSSEIPAQHLKNNRKMELKDDRWVVMLAADEKNITYTWKGGAAGDWADEANWTPSVTPCFGIPTKGYGNAQVTAKFPSNTPMVDWNTWINLGGGDYQVNSVLFQFGGILNLTNGTFNAQAGLISVGDSRFRVKDGVIRTADPIFGNISDSNFNLDGNVQVIGNISPNASSTWQVNDFGTGGSNEVTGVIHNRNAKFNVGVWEDATLVVGEIKAEHATNPLAVTLLKGATMKVGQIVAADVAGKLDFTFNVAAAGYAAAPVSFAKNDDGVALDGKTAVTVNIDEGFTTGTMPLFSGVGLSSETQPSVTVKVGETALEPTESLKIGLEEKDGVIYLNVKKNGMMFYVK